MIMKAKHLTSIKIVFLFTLLVVALTASSQNLDVPKNDFILSFSKDSLKLSPGENRQLDIEIRKSRSYGKSKIKMGISSSLPKGVAIAFDPDNGNFDSTKANILIEADAKPGQYLLILNATLNRKTKGAILNLLIK